MAVAAIAERNSAIAGNGQPQGGGGFGVNPAAILARYASRRLANVRNAEDGSRIDARRARATFAIDATFAA
jgi:hypothetical protein